MNCEAAHAILAEGLAKGVVLHRRLPDVHGPLREAGQSAEEARRGD